MKHIKSSKEGAIVKNMQKLLKNNLKFLTLKNNLEELDTDQYANS